MEKKNKEAKPTLAQQLDDLEKLYHRVRRDPILKAAIKTTIEAIGPVAMPKDMSSYIVNPHLGCADELKIPTETKTPSDVNNGGATSYYDLPPASARPCIDDLIEYKEMQRWQAEVFKSCYALKERAARSSDGSSSEPRELYKQIYYINRRLSQLSLPTFHQ